MLAPGCEDLGKHTLERSLADSTRNKGRSSSTVFSSYDPDNVGLIASRLPKRYNIINP
jgi:hypothetical protein